MILGRSMSNKRHEKWKTDTFNFLHRVDVDFGGIEPPLGLMNAPLMLVTGADEREFALLRCWLYGPGEGGLRFLDVWRMRVYAPQTFDKKVYAIQGWWHRTRLTACTQQWVENLSASDGDTVAWLVLARVERVGVGEEEHLGSPLLDPDKPIGETCLWAEARASMASQLQDSDWLIEETCLSDEGPTSLLCLDRPLGEACPWGLVIVCWPCSRCWMSSVRLMCGLRTTLAQMWYRRRYLSLGLWRLGSLVDACDVKWSRIRVRTSSCDCWLDEAFNRLCFERRSTTSFEDCWKRTDGAEGNCEAAWATATVQLTAMHSNWLMVDLLQTQRVLTRFDAILIETHLAQPLWPFLTKRQVLVAWR